MTLERSLRLLNSEIRALHHSLLEVRVTAVEDRPAAGANKLAEACGERVEEVLASSEHLVQLADSAQKRAAYPADIEGLRHDLGICQELFCDVLEHISGHLLAYEHLAALRTLGLELGREWVLWAEVLTESLGRSRAPLFRVNRALPECWQALAETAPGFVVDSQRRSRETRPAADKLPEGIPVSGKRIGLVVPPASETPGGKTGDKD